MDFVDIDDKVKKMRRSINKEGQIKGTKVEERTTNTPKTPRKSTVVPYFYSCASVEEEKLVNIFQYFLWNNYQYILESLIVLRMLMNSNIL